MAAKSYFLLTLDNGFKEGATLSISSPKTIARTSIILPAI